MPGSLLSDTLPSLVQGEKLKWPLAALGICKQPLLGEVR